MDRAALNATAPADGSHHSKILHECLAVVAVLHAIDIATVLDTTILLIAVRCAMPVVHKLVDIYNASASTNVTDHLHSTKHIFTVLLFVVITASALYAMFNCAVLPRYALRLLVHYTEIL
jgi:hypothetical protein